MIPSDDPEAELMALYRAESRDALRAAGRRLNSLRKAGKARKAGLLNGLRAAGHRLKGSGGTYGLDEVSRLGAALETLMKAALAGQRPPDAAPSAGGKRRRPGDGVPLDAVFRAEVRGLLDSLLAAFRP